MEVYVCVQQAGWCAHEGKCLCVCLHKLALMCFVYVCVFAGLQNLCVHNSVPSKQAEKDRV